MPLYNLVPSLLAPVTLSLMPMLGAALSKGERAQGREALAASLRLCLLIAIPASLGLAVFAEPILSMIYRGAGEAVSVAAPALSMLAPAVLPAVLLSLTGAALQAAGHTLLPVVAMGAGAAVKLTLEILLLPVSGIYIYAAPISTMACNLTVLVIEAVALSRLMGGRLVRAGDLFRVLAAALVGVGGAAALYFLLVVRFGRAVWVLPVALLCAVLLFLPPALLLGAVRREELAALPMGERLCLFLTKLLK